MKDLPSPHDELALRLLERWVTVVHADITRSLLHGRKRKVTAEQFDQAIRALQSVENDRALAKFISHAAPRWKAKLIVTSVIDLIGSLGDLPANDPLRAALRKQLADRTPLARIAKTALGRQRG